MYRSSTSYCALVMLCRVCFQCCVFMRRKTNYILQSDEDDRWNYPCHLSPSPAPHPATSLRQISLCVHLCNNTQRHYIKPSNNKSSFLSWECSRLCTNGSRIPPPHPPPRHSAPILAFCLNLAIWLHCSQGSGSRKGSVIMSR
jgi:hypothetical protein